MYKNVPFLQSSVKCPFSKTEFPNEMQLKYRICWTNDRNLGLNEMRISISTYTRSYEKKNLDEIN